MSDRTFDLVDLELLKRSPMSWQRQHYEKMGALEWDIRRGLGHSGPVSVAMRLLIRSAVHAYMREGGECPWDDDYRRKVAVASKDKARPEPVSTATTCVEHIIEHLKNYGRTRRADLITAVAAKGYAETTVSMRITDLTKNATIVTIGEGIFQLPSRGPRGKRKGPSTDAQPDTNDTDNEASE